MSQSEKKLKTGSMPAELKQRIERALEDLGEVERHKRSHHKAGPVQAKILPEEALLHEKVETIRKGSANRIHFRCSNKACTEPLRADKWDTHVITARSDRLLQEQAEDVLVRSMNFAPGPEYDDIESRKQRILTFIEMRHYLSLARAHDELDLAQRITSQCAFHIRLTNMVRRLM